MPEPAPSGRLLGGRILLAQPDQGYRAAADSVLLGAAVAAPAGVCALELGCGAGAALLVAAWRNPAARFVGVEREPALASLAQANIAANGLADRAEALAGDALAHAAAAPDRYDACFFNPPFFDDPSAMRVPAAPARRAAFVSAGEGLGAWMAAALRAVRPAGRITLIHRADRLDDALAALRGAAGEIRIKPIETVRGQPAKRALIRARRLSKSPLALLPALVLREADGTETAEGRAVFLGEAGVDMDG